MKVIFQVNDCPVLVMTISEDGQEINQVASHAKRLAEIAFPQVFKAPTVGQLLQILKAYAGIRGNVGLQQLAKRTHGWIGYIPFKQNLNIRLVDESKEE